MWSWDLKSHPLGQQLNHGSESILTVFSINLLGIYFKENTKIMKKRTEMAHLQAALVCSITIAVKRRKSRKRDRYCR